jgi:hypothetical protein
LPFHLKPRHKQLLVCLQADYEPHPYAQLHVNQNQYEARQANHHFMPHWPQIGLIARQAERATELRHVAYFGLEKNLAPELRSSAWSQHLSDLGFNWHIIPKERWHDYRDVDVTVAVRRFQDIPYKRKPATKLYNAWHAGVPAILGPESAYQAERKSDLDYLEVRSTSEILAALQRLKDRPDLYRQMVENGQARAASITPVALTQRWQTWLCDTVIPAYDHWCSQSKLTYKHYLAHRYLRIVENGLVPHAAYPHDNECQADDQLTGSDRALMATMQLYRSVRRRLPA